MIEGYVLRHADKGVLAHVDLDDLSDVLWAQPPALECVFKNYPRAIKVWMALPPEDQDKVTIQDQDGKVCQGPGRAPVPRPREAR